MADRDFQIGGSTTFKQRWVDLGNSVYAQGVALLSLIAGEDQINGRLRTESKPADEDSILETLQNAAVSVTVGTAINVKGYKGLTAQVVAASGTWGGGFQASIDGGTTYFYVQVRKVEDEAALAGSATQFNPAAAAISNLVYFPQYSPAWDFVRFNIAAWTSAAVTVKSRKHAR